MDDATFPDIIARIRGTYQISQQELGEMSGLSRSAITRLESGDRKPNRETIKKIADAFPSNPKLLDMMLIAADLMPKDTESLVTADERVIRVINALNAKMEPLERQTFLRNLDLLLKRAEKSTRKYEYARKPHRARLCRDCGGKLINDPTPAHRYWCPTCNEGKELSTYEGKSEDGDDD